MTRALLAAAAVAAFACLAAAVALAAYVAGGLFVLHVVDTYVSGGRP